MVYRVYFEELLGRYISRPINDFVRIGPFSCCSSRAAYVFTRSVGAELRTQAGSRSGWEQGPLRSVPKVWQLGLVQVAVCVLDGRWCVARTSALAREREQTRATSDAARSQVVVWASQQLFTVQGAQRAYRWCPTLPMRRHVGLRGVFGPSTTCNRPLVHGESWRL